MFKKSDELSFKLLDKLPKQILKQTDSLILALSKKSLLLAEYLAKELELKYDIMLQKSIYSPNNSELVIAKVSETENLILHEDLIEAFEIDRDWIYTEAKKLYEEKIKKDMRNYRDDEPLTTVLNKDVVLVNFTIEDGISTICAIKSLINLGAKSITLAVGIIPTNIYENLDRAVDDVYFVEKIDDFVNTAHYFRMPEEYDEELTQYILRKSRNFRRKNDKN